jgi:hypothetical protein
MMIGTLRTLHFQETQTFPRWLYVIPVMVLVLILTIIFLNAPKLLDILLPVVLVGGVALFLIASRLITEVRSDGLYIKFFPFHQTFRHFAFSDITSATARQYSALGEYGGWGIRYGFGDAGRTYNAKGTHGVQLIFKDGRKLLVGSQQAATLAEVIKQHLN